MTSEEHEFQALLESALKFTWIDGNVTPLCDGQTTEKHALPFAVVTQVMGGDADLYQGTAKPLRYCDGQAVVVKANTMHHFVFVGSGKIRARWAHCHITLFDSIDMLRLIDTPSVLPENVGNHVGDLCQALAEIKNEQPGLAAACRRHQIGFQLMNCLLQVSRPEENLRDLVQGLLRIAPVMRFLQNHFADPFTREDLAQVVNLSPTRFHFVFKEIMGTSPMHYVQQLRISKAQHLLWHTTFGIAEIAFKVGFTDPFHFSRIFKKYTGKSPLGYRLLHREPFA